MISPGVLLISEDLGNTEMLTTMLTTAGYRIDAHVTIEDDVYEAVKRSEPEVIVVIADVPSRVFMNQLYNMNKHIPKAIVIFAGESGQHLIDDAIKAGISSYIVDGLSPHRIQPVIEIARARFRKEQSIYQELKEMKSKLEERKSIERAKGIIMQKRNISEEEAFRSLRKLAMDRNQRLVDVANDVISLSEILT